MSVILNSGLKSNAWASLNDSVSCIVSVSCLYSCCSPNHYHRNPATATVLHSLPHCHLCTLQYILHVVATASGVLHCLLCLSPLFWSDPNTLPSPHALVFSLESSLATSPSPPTSFMFRSSNHLRSLLHTWHCHDHYLSTGIFLLRLQVSGRQGCVFCSPLYHPVLTWHIASIQKC